MTTSSQLDPLAVYGAIVGTFALLLNIFRFWYDRRKDSVQLRLTCRPHRDLLRNRDIISKPLDAHGDGPSMLPAYVVTVYNDGALPAHIANVGAVNSDDSDVSALVRSELRGLIYCSVTEKRLDPIEAKSSQEFTVYFQRRNPLIDAKSCFVVDRTGKRWKGRVSAAQIT